MPAPAVYVAIAVGSVAAIAAVITFKEFVYDPHIAPKVEEWWGELSERRRRARARRSGPVRPHSWSSRSSSSDSDDDDRPFGRGPGRDEGRRGLRGEEGSVELQNLVDRERNEWRSIDPQDGLRQRKGRNVIDESSGIVLYEPISPISTAVSTVPSSPASGPSANLTPVQRTQPIIHSPIPRIPARLAGDAIGVVAPSVLAPAATIVSPTIIPAERVSTPPGLPTPVSARSPAAFSDLSGSFHSDLARSASSASSFTPAVLGPRSTSTFDGSRTPSPGSDIIFSSPEFPSPPPRSNASAPARSDVGSPFTDIHAVSPPLSFVAASQIGANAGRSRTGSATSYTMSDLEDLTSASESDFAVLSPPLASATPVMSRASVTSPSGGLTRTETSLTFEVLSDDGSDGSDHGWENLSRTSPRGSRSP